jgi:hypothetical protein
VAKSTFFDLKLKSFKTTSTATLYLQTM